MAIYYYSCPFLRKFTYQIVFKMIKITKATITRRRILDKAFQKIYQSGYQATSIDKILEELEVTKGAFYYHFSNKKEMGLAVIKELIYPRLYKSLIEPIEKSTDPKEDILEVFQDELENLNDNEWRFGCSTQNLVVEMGAIDGDFNQLFQSIYKHWQTVIKDAFERGKQHGTVDPSTNATATASFIIVSYQGLRGVSKVQADLHIFDDYLAELEAYLEEK